MPHTGKHGFFRSQLGFSIVLFRGWSREKEEHLNRDLLQMFGALERAFLFSRGGVRRLQSGGFWGLHEGGMRGETKDSLAANMLLKYL